jgi:hypothetical protein
MSEQALMGSLKLWIEFQKINKDRCNNRRKKTKLTLEIKKISGIWRMKN